MDAPESLRSYLPLALMAGAALAVGAGQMLLSQLVGFVRRSRTDTSPYECGSEPLDANRKRISVKYYMVAVLFLLFDLEIVFLLPWALKFKEMTLGGQAVFALVEMGLFLAFLLVGYLYILKRDALEWD